MSFGLGLAFVRREKHMTDEEIEADDRAWEYYWKHHRKKLK